MIVTVRVDKVTLDTATNRFVVVLKDDVNRRWLPIVVGSAEAQAIALQLENISPPRPLTHDLMKNLLDTVGVNVSKVVVSDLRENTYYAIIGLKRNGVRKEVDARPSDAIALALRTKAPIFVDEKVMRKAAISEVPHQRGEKSKLEMLNIELEKAVREERFEDAARIRDEIRDLNSKREENQD